MSRYLDTHNLRLSKGTSATRLPTSELQHRLFINRLYWIGNQILLPTRRYHRSKRAVSDFKRKIVSKQDEDLGSHRRCRTSLRRDCWVGSWYERRWERGDYTHWTWCAALHGWEWLYQRVSKGRGAKIQSCGSTVMASGFQLIPLVVC